MFHQGEFAALAKMLNHGVVLLDRETNLQFASPSALALLDYKDTMSLKQGWRDCYGRWKLPDLAPLEKNNRPLRHRVDISTSTVTRMLRMEIYALQHGNCDCYLILLKDRQSHDASERQLIVASQLHLQRYLTSSLSHDLNAPVNTMRITLELMERMMVTAMSERSDGRDKWERYMGIFGAELDKLKAIVAAIPMTSNLALPSVPEQFDVLPLIEGLGNILKHETAAKQIRRKWVLPPHTVSIYGRVSEIKLALLNLAISFVESIKMGGSLSLVVTSSDAWVEIIFSADMAEFEQQAVDEFEQLAFTSEKNGIGLFAARLILEAHGGSMRVDLPPSGVGASILVLIPRYHPVLRSQVNEAMA